MDKRIFITGAAGFIGFHLAQALNSKGYTLIGCDNFNDYYDPALKRQRALKLKGIGVDVLEGDICDMSFLQNIVDGGGVTHVVNLAAQVGVRYSVTNPGAYITSNIEGFMNILELCRHNPSIALVYASSSSVYGLNEKRPFSVDDITDRPASLYGATKKTNELMAFAYHHLYGISVTGLRFFTVYGPWGRPDMAVFGFAEKISKGKPIDVYNNGDMMRDFTYIDDIVNGIVAAIERDATCEVFNLGNNKTEKLSLLIELLERELATKAIKQYLPMQQGDVKITYADIDHSRKVLGYHPQTSLEQGIEKFVQWFSTWENDHET